MAEPGLDAEKTAEVLGTSRRTIFRKREEFRHQDDASRNSWGGGGRRRFSLSIGEEREFLSAWEAAATAGGVLSVPAGRHRPTGQWLVLPWYGSLGMSMQR